MNNGKKIIYDTEIAYLFDNLGCACIILLTIWQQRGRLRIKVFNYRQKLRDKSSAFFWGKTEKILSKSHIVCLRRESVSEARMDVFQAMTWWRRTITCCNALRTAEREGKKWRKCFYGSEKNKSGKFIQLSGHDLYKISRFLPLSVGLFLLIISRENFYCSFCKWKTRFEDIFAAASSCFFPLACYFEIHGTENYWK